MLNVDLDTGRKDGEVLMNTKTGDSLKIAMVTAADQIARRQGAIARLAFFESGAWAPGQELEKWLSAKSKLVKALSYDMVIREGDIWVGIDTRLFEEGTIEAWVSPKLITICGKARKLQREAPGDTSSDGTEDMIFHVLEPPAEIDPSTVTGNFNGALLEIRFGKARGGQKEVKAA